MIAEQMQTRTSVSLINSFQKNRLRLNDPRLLALDKDGLKNKYLDNGH